MITITKRLEWDAAHRVLRHESKCATLHGHRYAAEITATAPELDSVGRVIDFGVIKSEVGAWIDEKWDHTTIVNYEDHALLNWCAEQAGDHDNRRPYIMPCETTAENIASTLFRIASGLLARHGVQVVAVTVYETPTSRATYTES